MNVLARPCWALRRTKRFVAVLAVLVLAGSADAGDTKTKVIPLESVHTSGNQYGLELIAPEVTLKADGTMKYGGPCGELLERLVAEHTCGAANIFLVCGSGLRAAIGATCATCVDSIGVWRSVLEDGTATPKSHWLAVYLGVLDCDPPQLCVCAVEQRGKTVRFTIAPRNPENVRETHDENNLAFWFWVPLGNLDEGVYTLELYDESTRSVVLMRRVTVGANPGNR